MDTTLTATPATRKPTTYTGNVPKTLRDWIAKHCADKVYDVDYGGGYATDSGNAYDVGIVPGWCLGAAYDRSHTLIEPTVRDVIARLKTLQPCHDDDECRQAWAKVTK